MSRNILVVEDNQRWQKLLKELSEECLQEIREDKKLTAIYSAPTIPSDRNNNVNVASTLSEAQAFFTDSKIDNIDNEPVKPVDLLILDINLTDETHSTTEGWNLLQFIKEKGDTVVTIVVSGEESPQRVIEGLMHHGAFSYIWKGNFRPGQFKTYVKLAVLYNDSINLLSMWNWYYTKVAVRIWDYALKSTRQDQLQKVEMPEKNDIKNEYDRRVDSLTKIPSATWSKRIINDLMNKSNWIFFSITIQGLEAFSSLIQGSQHADEVRRVMAYTLNKVVEEYGDDEDFIGQVDGEFVLISTPDKGHDLLSRVKDEFEQKIPQFYDYQDVEKGFSQVKINGETKNIPFMTMVGSYVTDLDGPFTDNREITKLASERKRI